MTHMQIASPQQDMSSGADRAGALHGGARPEPGHGARRSAGARGRGLHGQLVQQLGQMIVSGEVDADHPLVPEEIGERFEVSRTVVRETLRVLEAKGLVTARPNVGTRVRPVSEWSLLDPDVVEWRAFGPQREDQQRELVELRSMIEPLAARLTAEHGRKEVNGRLGDLVATMERAADQDDSPAFAGADAEFHALLAQASGNQMLEHLFGVVSGALRVYGASSAGCDGPGEPSPAHHARVAEAVATGDGAAAEAAMRQLLTVHHEAERLPVPAPRGH
ncbi:FadR/GntR family transcriptional regulator [Streptomyces sp. NPDC006251]|uniref:FadR/GntR family transcriptional regulator n=1 Tax=Streptomyces sp. NPDC006251 TaxID=3155718 RepID=UPI0033AC6B66